MHDEHIIKNSVLQQFILSVSKLNFQKIYIILSHFPLQYIYVSIFSILWGGGGEGYVKSD